MIFTCQMSDTGSRVHPSHFFMLSNVEEWRGHVKSHGRVARLGTTYKKKELLHAARGNCRYRYEVGKACCFPSETQCGGFQISGDV